MSQTTKLDHDCNLSRRKYAAWRGAGQAGAKARGWGGGQVGARRREAPAERSRWSCTPPIPRSPPPVPPPDLLSTQPLAPPNSIGRLLPTSGSPDFGAASLTQVGRRERPRARARGGPRGGDGARQAGRRAPSVRRRRRRPPRLRDCASAPPAGRGSRDARRRRRRWRWCVQPCVAPGGGRSWVSAARWRRGRCCGHQAGERPQALEEGGTAGTGWPGS